MAKLDIERESKKPRVDVTIQVVIAAQKWTTGVESLVLRLGDPVVCITDHVESCIYSGIKPKVSCLMKQKKIEKLVGKFVSVCSIVCIYLELLGNIFLLLTCVTHMQQE